MKYNRKILLRAKGEKEKRENNVCKVYKRSSKKHVKEKKKRQRERERGVTVGEILIRAKATTSLKH